MTWEPPSKGGGYPSGFEHGRSHAERMGRVGLRTRVADAARLDARQEGVMRAVRAWCLGVARGARSVR